METDYAFHIHTFRCGHASDEKEEAYIQKAVELGLKSIWFSDHAPFPGDRFTSRMRYTELDDYISTLQSLRNKYTGKVEVHIGLEAEYLPEYESYYDELRDRLDFMLLGQHLYKVNGFYNYQLSKEDRHKNEEAGISEMIIAGMESRKFDYVAHPDRCFRFSGEFGPEQYRTTTGIMQVSAKSSIPLEQNEESKRSSLNLYRKEFWECLPNNVRLIYGLDAHSTDELYRIKI